MVKTCSQCGSEFRFKRSDAVFCSDRCRSNARNSGGIPQAMRRRKRWLRWTKTKRPVTVDGWPADVTDPECWSSYGDARKSTAGVGLGFVLGNGIGCYDLDHCFHDGALDDWAREILDEHRDEALFVEVSQSGEGLHIFVRTDAPHARVTNFGDHRVEFYPNKRYIAVTGDRFEG